MKLLLLSLLALLAACVARPTSQPPAPAESEELALLEASCRWYIADQRERGESTQVLFVEAAPGVDAPSALLERLAALGRIVRPASAASEDRSLGTVDRESGAPGSLLRARAITHLPDGRVELTFEAYAGPEGGERARLTLVHEAAGWRVQFVRDREIS